MFAAACPCMQRCQWPALSTSSTGSEPMAVGKSSSSAPLSARQRAVSGNHWSQQMPTPMRAYRVFHTRKPVFPGVK